MNYFAKFKNNIDEQLNFKPLSKSILNLRAVKRKGHINESDKLSDDDIETQLPPPVPLLPKQFRYESEPIRHAFIIDVLYLFYA